MLLMKNQDSWARNLSESSVYDYMNEVVRRMRTAHEVLRERQWQVRSGDPDDPSLYRVRYD